MKTLFNELEKRENERRKFDVIIHGGKIDETKTTVPTSSSDDPLLFRDPKEYEHLTEEERKELTRKMKEGHKEILEKSKTSLLN